MAHFAEIDDNGRVLRVIRISNDDAPDPAPHNSEPLGQFFIANYLGLPGQWVQVSYNGNFRKQYPTIGFQYDADADVFISPQPYPSWNLDANYDWQPPVPMPSEDGLWDWNEETQSWV